MTLFQVHESVSDGDLDFHAVSELTTIGVLADDVVGDLIRVRAGMLQGSDSAALRKAAGVFTAASAAISSRGQLWAPNKISDTLRLLADSHIAGPEASVDEDSRDWVTHIATDLEAVVGNDADQELVARLQQEFSMISIGTFAASTDAIRHRGFASSWLTT